MVLSEVVNTQYAFPVGIVVICAILVFVFGFKSAEEPPFDQLTNTYTGDDRKPAGKKRKLNKDKKSQSNGHATAVGDSHAEVKASSTKSTAKPEKSPLKEVSNKIATKQSKKHESPIKEKSAVKQLKDKKQVAEKSPSKAIKNVASKTKVKGKENEVAELKNKKNEKNLANLKKAEGKPARIDDGGWKQVLSSKDKKNRKKDEPELYEIIPEKKVGKMDGSPKKKKSKNIELVMAPATIENKDIEKQKEIKEAKPKAPEKVKKAKKIVEKKSVEVPEKNGGESEKKAEKKTEKKKENKPEKLVQNSQESDKKTEKSNKKVEKGPEEKKVEKQNEKKKKVELEPSGAKAVNEKANIAKKTKVLEKSPVAETKPLDELSPESLAKAKKNKNKASPKPEPKAENPGSPKQISLESSGNSDSNKSVKPVEVVIESKTKPSTTVIFDELGDTWKEAKIPKSKKKVRKDQ